MLKPPPDRIAIEPHTTLYEVFTSCHPAVEVINGYNKVVGDCISCTSLFLSIEEIAQKYSLDMQKLLEELREAAETA